VFCAHRKCLGFSLLTNPEGPSTVFDVVYTRFKTAPKLIVYDNACNLHKYVLRRAPQFFSNTAFRIDRLHIYNHEGCSSGYNLATYPNHMSVATNVRLDKLNTQIAEQVNSLLDGIRTQVAYMGHDNAMAYVKFFLAQYNIRQT